VSGLRTAVVTSTLAALLLTPMVADAQRRAVQRVPPARSSVAVPAPAGRYYPAGRYSQPYYRNYGYYRPYAYYDPFFYGSSFAFGIGFGFGYGYGYPYAYGYPGYPYAAYGAYPYPYYGGGYYDGSAALRLQVMPRETQVYIDGYYAGVVDSFDGTFQRLHAQPGSHEVQLYLPGHRSFSQTLYLQPANTISLRHTMEPLQPGDPEPVKPVAQPRPQQQPPPQNGLSAAPRRPNGRQVPPPQVADRDRDQDADRGAITQEKEFGSISLRVQPGDATVSIDGERWETASDDRLTLQLGAGVHNIQIRKDGYRTYITDVTVRPGATTPLNVALTKQ
jgi:hypothetical protein